MARHSTSVNWQVTLNKDFPNMIFNSLSTKDVANIALQRTSTLLRVPFLGRVSVTAWKRGRSEPLLLEAYFRRNTLLRRAIEEVLSEFNEIASFLEDKPIPKRIADIGCGHALIDVLFWQYYSCAIHLIDIETSAWRYHEFNSEGAGYASLSAATRLLLDNGVPHNRITATNPTKNALNAEPLDLAISLLSCGFHYPANTYLDFLSKSLSPGRFFICDLRKGIDQRDFCSHFSSATTLRDCAKYTRVALCK